MMKILTISFLILSFSVLWSQDSISAASALSPNGDGVNDSYLMPTGDYSMVKFTIYNRWGESLFNSTSIETEWDGLNKKKQKCANGVYMYVFTYEVNKEEKTQSGNITLMR
jgi:gliding motility-associated-like protein